MDAEKRETQMNIVDKKKLFEAKRALNAFLEKSPPELREYQQQIDRELEKAGKNPNDQMVVLFKMIHDNQTELIATLEELNGRLTRQRDDLFAISRKTVS
jgi:hypothetical protein